MKAPIGKLTEEILKNEKATKALMEATIVKNEKSFQYKDKIYKLSIISP